MQEEIIDTAVNSQAIETLPVETTAQIETTAVITTVSENANTHTNVVNSNSMVIYTYLIIAVCAVLGLFMIIRKMFMRKRKTGVTDTQSAKYRDEQRINAEKARNNSKTTDSKKKVKKADADKIRDVIRTLPYKSVCKNNIWLIDDKTYSKAYTFDDINFNLVDEDTQYSYFDRYISFLNTLDDTIDCQVSVWNNRVNIDSFRAAVLMKENNDAYSELRYEYNKKVLEANIEKGQNAVKKHMCITLTIKASDEEAAADRFKSIDISIIDAFNNIGATNMRVMTSQERVEMLKDYFIGTDYNIPQITDEQYTKGEEKLFCSPDYFEFKYDYFMFNEYYARAMYVKDFPNRAGSNIVKDIIDTSLDCIVTVNLSCLAPDAAQKLVRKKMYEIDTDMSARSRKAAQHGDFTSTIPETIRIKRESLSKIYEKITEQDQRLFFANVIIMVKSKELSELNSNCRIIEDIFKRNSYLTGKLTFQQEAAMNDCLPCGYKRRLDIQRTMPSESAAIFLPFNVTEVQMPNASYYGLNKLSNNIIMFDRVTGLKNPSGFFLGCPGSGKSFTAKREMVDVILRNPDADVLIVDPEREYQGIVTEFGGTVVKFGGNSKSYINPFAYSMSMLDVDDDDSEFGSIIDSKTSLIQSFMSVMDSKNPLTAQEQSFVDRCIKKCYLKTGVLETQNPDDMPTLSTLYQVMKDETEFVNKAMQEKLVMTLEMYVDGSARYFNNPTNVDDNNRIISYDIKDLSGVLKTQGMLLILDYIWNRLSENRNKGKLTYVYCDEIYLLFQDEYCLDYLRMLWKRARKYGGVLTGITQNVEDLLKDDKSRSMLSNSEFLILLNQNPVDAAKLQQILNFSDNEAKYLNDIPSGHGVVVIGSGGKVKIPFYDEFPKDTQLYSKMSTNFSEIAKAMRKKTNA